MTSRRLHRTSENPVQPRDEGEGGGKTADGAWHTRTSARLSTDNLVHQPSGGSKTAQAWRHSVLFEHESAKHCHQETDHRSVLLLAYVSQISRPVEASQALVSSSRLTIPSLPDGGRCCGQTSKMWSTVCSGAPHSQTEESLRPHFSMDELNRPTPVRRRLRVVHCFRAKSRPGTLCGSRMKLCSLEGGAASQSSFQRVLSQDCFVTPGGAKSLR